MTFQLFAVEEEMRTVTAALHMQSAALGDVFIKVCLVTRSIQSFDEDLGSAA